MRAHWARSAEFQMLSDLLRNGANAPTYEDIFREILDYDENVRDLLLRDPADENAAGTGAGAEEAARGGIAGDGGEDCDTTLSRRDWTNWRGNRRLTPEEVAEFTDLSAKGAQMKAARVVSRDS